LVCAYRLRQRSVAVQLYEATERTGGRVLTDRKTFGSLFAEFGGELIDTGHKRIQGLCKIFDLELDDLLGGNPKLPKDVFFFRDRSIPEEELVKELIPSARAMQSELNDLGPLDLPSQNKKLRTLEEKYATAAEWLKVKKIDGLAVDVLRSAFTSELGLDLEDLAWLPMIQMFQVNEEQRRLMLYGESDERYRIRGGNDKLTRNLQENLVDTLSFGHRLVRLRRSGERFQCTFQRGASSSLEVLADFVVLALPFSVLRSERRLVELDASLGLSPLKRRCIDELAYGTNAKLMIGFKKRSWNMEGYSGSIFTDLDFQSTWDTSRAQPGKGGIITSFRGGKAGERLGKGQDTKQKMLDQLKRAIPKISWNAEENQILLADWPHARHGVFGSYATYGPRQPGILGGLEAEPAGNLLFAGEHTSTNFQGYMEGAVESGERAANEILARLGKKTTEDKEQ
jgi:monoamine oxidase